MNQFWRTLVPCWFFAVVILWILIWRVTRTRSLSIRGSLRSLAIALAFAPTALTASWIAFPAPASLVLAAYLFEPKKSYSKEHFDNLYLAGASLVVFWLLTIFFYVSKVEARQRMQKREEKLANAHSPRDLGEDPTKIKNF